MQQAEVVNGGESIQVPIADRHALHRQRLAIQRLRLVVLALILELLREPIQGEGKVLAPRIALGLEPCTE